MSIVRHPLSFVRLFALALLVPGVVAGRAADVKVPLTIATSADLNPDVGGRASPVVVRIYQLKSDAAFLRADFFALFDDEQKTLAAELVLRDEHVLQPKEIRNVQIALSDEARVVGVVAAFRDIRNAEWRVATQAPIKGLTISVERARLVLFPD